MSWQLGDSTQESDNLWLLAACPGASKHDSIHVGASSLGSNFRHVDNGEAKEKYGQK